MSKDNVSIDPDGNTYPIPSEADIRASFNDLATRAEQHRARGRKVVVVQGLGFVGTAVAAVVANALDSSGYPRYFVVGVDLPSPSSYWKVARLNQGMSPVISSDPKLPQLVDKGVNGNQNLSATVSEDAYSLGDIIVVDVPLGVNDRFAQSTDDITIDLESFKAAIRVIGSHMRPEALVLVETTVPVGTCEKIVLPILREERKQRGIDDPICLAHAYERVMPGSRYVESICQYWRTFSGINKSSTERARRFLASFVDTENFPLRELDNPLDSELAKLLENSYRAANIAFIHEWTLLAEQIGVNLFEVIESIRVRKGTHDNMRFPGFGVGGYCLPKDPLLAQWSSTHLLDADVRLNMTLDSLSINNEMPLHTFNLICELVEGELVGELVVVCGVSYRPGVADTRHSPTETLVDALLDAGSEVIVHDPYVAIWSERPNIPLSQDLSECLREASGIVFAVAHRAYRDLSPREILEMTSSSPFIVDAQNVISDEEAESLRRSGCRLLGVGKGHWRARGYQCL